MAQVIKMSVTVNNTPILDDHILPTSFENFDKNLSPLSHPYLLQNLNFKILNSNLFTHEALGSSYELVLTCPCVGSVWKCWFLRRGENWSTHRKTSRSKGENNNKLNPHMALTPGFEPGPDWWEVSAFTTAPPLLPKHIFLILGVSTETFTPK